MTQLTRRWRKRLQPVLRYAPTGVEGLRHARLFDDVERFCLFIGYPRSGHSLVGSLLDAHPEVVLAHELDVLRYVGVGYRRNQLYWMILERDAEFTGSGRRWNEFDYTVPGQWQGRYERLRIIGDKKGGASTARLERRPELLDRLRRIVVNDVQLIHVVRNPFDNIATMSRRNRQSLEVSADRYFAMCETTRRIIRNAPPGSVIDVRHESLIQDSKAFLRTLCAQLGLSATDEYLDACAGIVFPSPHRSRHDVIWESGLICSIEDRVSKFSFLSGYAFDDDVSS